MKYRIAKIGDLNRIIDLHLKVKDTYPVGLFSEMGRSFFKMYYRIILEDPYEIVLCAEDELGRICGFSSGSLDVSEQMANLKKNKIKLALAALPTIFRKPSVMIELWKRYRSISKSEGQFIVQEGARSEYWVWDQDLNDPISSVEMLNVMYEMFYILGIGEISFEVDLINRKVYKFHMLNGAVVVDEIKLSDGRERKIMKYNLDNKFKTKRL